MRMFRTVSTTLLIVTGAMLTGCSEGEKMGKFAARNVMIDKQHPVTVTTAKAEMARIGDAMEGVWKANTTRDGTVIAPLIAEDFRSPKGMVRADYLTERDGPGLAVDEWQIDYPHARVRLMRDMATVSYTNHYTAHKVLFPAALLKGHPEMKALADLPASNIQYVVENESTDTYVKRDGRWQLKTFASREKAQKVYRQNAGEALGIPPRSLLR